MTEPWRDQLRRKAFAVIRLWRALTRGEIAAVVFRFAGVLCSIGGIALLWVNVQQVHNTGSHTDSGQTELGASLIVVAVWLWILRVALVGQSQRDQQNNPLAIPLWLLIAGAIVVTCLAVTVAILVFPGIVSGRPAEARLQMASGLMLALAVINLICFIGGSMVNVILQDRRKGRQRSAAERSGA